MQIRKNNEVKRRTQKKNEVKIGIDSLNLDEYNTVAF